MEELDKQYDGSEMDEIESPPLKMVGVGIFLTFIGVLYVVLVSLILSL